MRCFRSLFLLATLLGTAARADEPPRPVATATAIAAPLETRLELTGTVTANRRSQLSSRAAGLIAKVHVDAGDEVKESDVLMELDTKLAEITAERLAVELEQAELELEEALRRVEEVRELAERGSFPRSEADTRRTAAKVRESLVRRLQVQLKEQEEILRRHRLVAPYDGVIGEKFADEGEWVETGTAVVELVETGRLRLDVRAPQEVAAFLKGEVGAEVALDAYPGRELKAKVAATVPVKDAVSRTFLIRLELDDPEGLASPGMSARVEFQFTGEERVVQVPRDAVVRFPDGTAKVWTVVREGDRQVAKSRVVEVGSSLTRTIEVMEGVDDGAVVIVRGNEGLRESQPVETLAEGPDGKP